MSGGLANVFSQWEFPINVNRAIVATQPPFFWKQASSLQTVQTATSQGTITFTITSLSLSFLFRAVSQPDIYLFFDILNRYNYI